ncbi:MAG: PTS sugar transporter subunit IIA [Verrucomicrobia bacterium]|nr:PTS sugar transporter subunit IIA [Verrucomicrobiota bacterium]
MDFKTALKNGCYSISLKGETKREIIAELVDLLVAGNKIAAADRESVLQAVLDRERRMSTGVQHGVAIPHGKSEVVDELVSVVALKPEGGSLDGQPSRIFVMTISSVLRTGPHLQYLAEISKLLNVPSFREKVLAAKSVEELMGLLTG